MSGFRVQLLATATRRVEEQIHGLVGVCHREVFDASHSGALIVDDNGRIDAKIEVLLYRSK
jgi:hypothetical protein